jgi:hypothetical protein
MTLARHLRIGILQRGYNPCNAGGNDRVSAWRRFAVMRTWLERDVDRRAAGLSTGAAERLDLGVRPAPRLRPAAADDFAVLDDDRADRRIWQSTAKAATAERKCKRHVPLIVRHSFPLDTGRHSPDTLSHNWTREDTGRQVFSSRALPQIGGRCDVGSCRVGQDFADSDCERATASAPGSINISSTAKTAD